MLKYKNLFLLTSIPTSFRGKKTKTKQTQKEKKKKKKKEKKTNLIESLFVHNCQK